MIERRLSTVRKRYNLKNVWTSDRKILYKDRLEKLRGIIVNRI